MKYKVLLICLLLSPALVAQSITGIWEGTYNHFFPKCCEEINYKCRFKVYEDARGGMWIISETSPVSDEHAFGQLYAIGYKMPESGKIVFKELTVLFNTLRYTQSCFNTCRWCIKESMLTYNRQGKTEILSGLWNSKDCFPGGEISLQKVSDLPAGENFEIMKLGLSETVKTDPVNYMQSLYKFRKTDNPNEIKIRVGAWYNEVIVPVENPDDFLNKEDDYTLQNFTTHLSDDGTRQLIIYFDIKNMLTGKVTTYNPRNIGKNEIRNYSISLSGLTFPDKKGWEEIMATVEKNQQKSTTNLAAGETITDNQIKNRRFVVRKKPVDINKSSDIFIQVWDNNVEDGDIISLYVNDICVLENFMLTKTKKTINNLPLTNGKNHIVMYAENLGKIPPNTAALSIHVNGKQLHVYHMESDMKVSEALELVLQ